MFFKVLFTLSEREQFCIINFMSFNLKILVLELWNNDKVGDVSLSFVFTNCEPAFMKKSPTHQRKLLAQVLQMKIYD